MMMIIKTPCSEITQIKEEDIILFYRKKKRKEKQAGKYPIVK